MAWGLDAPERAGGGTIVRHLEEGEEKTCRICGQAVSKLREDGSVAAHYRSINGGSLYESCPGAGLVPQEGSA